MITVCVNLFAAFLMVCGIYLEMGDKHGDQN